MCLANRRTLHAPEMVEDEMVTRNYEMMVQHENNVRLCGGNFMRAKLERLREWVLGKKGSL